MTGVHGRYRRYSTGSFKRCVFLRFRQKKEKDIYIATYRASPLLKNSFPTSDGMDCSTVQRNFLLFGIPWVAPLNSAPSHVIKTDNPGILVTAHRAVTFVWCYALDITRGRPKSDQAGASASQGSTRARAFVTSGQALTANYVIEDATVDTAISRRYCRNRP